MRSLSEIKTQLEDLGISISKYHDKLPSVMKPGSKEFKEFVSKIENKKEINNLMLQFSLLISELKESMITEELHNIAHHSTMLKVTQMQNDFCQSALLMKKMIKQGKIKKAADKVDQFENKIKKLKGLHDSIHSIIDSNLGLEDKMSLYNNNSSLHLASMLADCKTHRTLLKELGLHFTKTAKKMLKNPKCAKVVIKKLR